MAENEKKRPRQVLALTAQTLGRGNDMLGSTLAVNFLRTIAFRDEVPRVVVCYNEGVKLAEQGSAAVPMLEALAQKGADIILCGTCVNYFEIRDRLAVGRIGDMHGIVEVLLTADSVVYL
ncbi:MAG: sulfurtransferase-like selenium metabolism protein YedF [Dehalococcoidales bacterium]|nr:sulfurtransferase-like selenium metabolism protein YedF [Dehalococcoidales bacterium]